jgi:outer membrane protein assembly factor BamB
MELHPLRARRFLRINLSSGECTSQDFPVDAAKYPTNIPGGWSWGTGFGSSPAVVDGRVYCALLEGEVLCLDSATLGEIWKTNLVHVDPTQQYVEQGAVVAACWTSPLVVNGRVYVGCGLGDRTAVADPITGQDVIWSEAGFGFVYCLDAETGCVVWLFCTNQEEPTRPNSPNQIPPSLRSAVAPAETPFGYMESDPPSKGGPVWSSLAYDAVLNRVYVGVGNSYPDGPLHTPWYTNGLLALDATSGAFAGFFQPNPSDSYRPSDSDVDMAGSPVLFTSPSGVRVVGIGGKTGSFFLVRADDLSQVLARQQLLPYLWNGSTPVPIAAIREPDWGIFTVAAVDWENGKLFVGMGSNGNFDWTSTPFVRALDWATLRDAWPTKPVKTYDNSGNFLGDVYVYDIPNSPLYTQKNGAAISSPAVSNGVVFVTTTLPAIYAFDVASGACLWGDTTTITRAYPLGCAVIGNMVVVASGRALYRWQIPPSPTAQDAGNAGVLGLLLLNP